jgi:DNA invertase Pin-like site-specific DNA recombinase
MSVPAILYAAKSTEDRRESIPGQLATCREWCDREGFTVIDEYKDEGFSAYSGNRGEGLRAAREHAARIAEEQGCVVMLVCRHSDRISRGAGDKPGASQALVEIWHASRRANVHLRSTSRSDDRDLETSAGAASIGERNRADSERKSESVRDGYDRARRRRMPLFGITPDGYLMERWFDSNGDAQRRMVKDPERAPLWDLVWRLAREGASVRSIVLALDRENWLTSPRKAGHRPRPFDANRIRLALTNPLYAGLQVGRVHEDDCDSSRKPCCAHRTEIVGEGDWPAYVTVEDFHALQQKRIERSHGGKGTSKGGRPAIGYLLGMGLARCACGAPMDCVTGRWERKDGTRPRRYVCRVHRERPQDCAMLPVDALAVDRLVLEGLDAVLSNADTLRAQVDGERRAQRERQQHVISQARERAAAAEQAAERAEADYAAVLDDEDARQVALRVAATKRREAQQATDLCNATLDALSQPATEQETDALARAWESLSGRVKDADGDVRQLNSVLREAFPDGFRLELVDDELWVSPNAADAAGDPEEALASARALLAAEAAPESARSPW